MLTATALMGRSRSWGRRERYVTGVKRDSYATRDRQRYVTDTWPAEAAREIPLRYVTVDGLEIDKRPGRRAWEWAGIERRYMRGEDQNYMRGRK
jgi:hypothetical protein